MTDSELDAIIRTRRLWWIAAGVWIAVAAELVALLIRLAVCGR